MELQNIDFPKHILLDMPKGKMCTIAGQSFSTDDLPDKLQATFEGVVSERRWWSEVSLVKYSVEPIFSLQIPVIDGKNGEYYDIGSTNELCRLILREGIEKVRNAIPEDEFVERETGKRPYWLFDSNDKYHLTFVKDGTVWKTSVVGCESGYYYECHKSNEDCLFRKVGNIANLFQESMAVRPVVFFDAKAFVKSQEFDFAFA